jgi:hypothetical protein
MTRPVLLILPPHLKVGASCALRQLDLLRRDWPTAKLDWKRSLPKEMTSKSFKNISTSIQAISVDQHGLYCLPK